MSIVPKLVFDIETIGQDFDQLDEISQNFLIKYAENEEEAKDLKEKTSFYPLTGEVIVVGFLNPDTHSARIYARDDGLTKSSYELAPGVLVEWGDEKSLLEKFWQTVSYYHIFISFYGRSFDVPFLMIRSAILGVKPTKNLLASRYFYSQPEDAKHIDLADQFSFYGTLRKKFPLHMWSKAFGIESPKDKGISGDNVGELFRDGQIEKIVEYNWWDLKATAQLYKKWEEYLSFFK